MLRHMKFTAGGGDWIIETNNSVGAISTHGIKQRIDFKKDIKEKRKIREFNVAIDGIESLVLACACGGIEVEGKEFVQAVNDAVEACAEYLL